MQNIAERQKARDQSQTLASICKKNINMLKATENPQNIDIDMNLDGSFYEQIQFTNPGARFKAHGLIEPSEDESEANEDDDLQLSSTTGPRPKRKSGIDEIDIFEFFITGVPNPPILEGIEEEKLLKIQKNIQDTLKERDAERERNITKRMKKYEQKYDFINKALLESVAHISEMTMVITAAKMKSDRMVMLPTLFDGTKPKLAKQHYERFNFFFLNSKLKMEMLQI